MRRAGRAHSARFGWGAILGMIWAKETDKQIFKTVFLLAVLRFRIRIHIFLGIPDPDPLVRGMDPDPDPSTTMQKK